MKCRHGKEPRTCGFCQGQALEGTIVDAPAVAVVAFTPAQALDLARSWEREADGLDGRAAAAWTGAEHLDDFALALVGGTAAQLRADALRDCARELRALVARAGGS